MELPLLAEKLEVSEPIDGEFELSIELLPFIIVHLQLLSTGIAEEPDKGVHSILLLPQSRCGSACSSSYETVSID